MHADQTQDNKSESISKDVSQLQSSGESTFEFDDNRPAAIVQRKLQEMSNNSPQTLQLRAFQQKANNSPQAKQPAQLQAISDIYTAKQQHPIQKKASPEPGVSKNNTGLPDTLKTGMENLSGMSLDDVKVHRNSDKPAQLQAHAYAQGTDIHLGPGQEKHLPHELGHVVQQKQGRVKPTLQMKGKVNVNDDAGLEKEADVMGAKAIQGKFEKPSLIQRMINVFPANQPAQLGKLDKDTMFAPPESGPEIYSESDFNLQKNLHYVESVGKMVDDWKLIDFGAAIKDKKQIERLKNFNKGSILLNSIGIGLGVATAVTFTCVTAGAGGVAILGVLTAWQLGVACSGAGLGLTALKAATTAEKPTGKEAALDVSTNSLENATGNSALVVGAMEASAGVAAGSLGAFFAAYGLYGDAKDYAKLNAKQNEVLNDLGLMQFWLEEKSEVLTKMQALEDNALLKHASNEADKEKYLAALVPKITNVTTKLNSEILKLKVLKGKIGKAIPKK